jgi:hypothetical protein
MGSAVGATPVATPLEVRSFCESVKWVLVGGALREAVGGDAA